MRVLSNTARLSLLSVAVIVIAVLAGAANYSPLPSDEMVIRRFKGNRANFEILASMFENDSATYVSNNRACRSDTQIPDTRLSNYSELLKLCHSDDVSIDSCMIKFRMASDDHEKQGRSKGLARVDCYQDVMELYSSLDGSFFNGETRMSLRHVDGPWYVYVEAYALTELPVEGRFKTVLCLDSHFENKSK